MYKYVYKNVSAKISVKTIKRQNKRQNILGFGSKILRLCLRIETLVQMLEKKVLFAKFRTMTWDIAKIHKSLVKKLTLDVLIFKIVLNYWKIITVLNTEHKYEPFREINKINRYFKQIEFIKNITLNSINLMKTFLMKQK